MKAITRLSLFMVVSLFLSCTNQSPLEPEVNQVVIRGYLYANEPVKDIQITSTLPLGSEETSAPPINDAEVYLLKDGKRYDLVPSAGDSGYYHYEGNDLSVEEGDVFRINVAYYGRIASGETVVPPSPKNVSISADTLFVPESIVPYEFEFDSTKNLIKVTWTKDQPADLFFITIENLEANPDSIELDGMMRGKARRFISAPTSRDEYQISFFNVNCYGRHSIKVYRINQEYADLYISRQQNSRDLNEPLTNIKNGLGVFSAFNSDSLYFQVVKE